MSEPFRPPGGVPEPREEHSCDCGLVWSQKQGAERDDCPRCGVREMADRAETDRSGVATSEEWGAVG